MNSVLRSGAEGAVGLHGVVWGWGMLAVVPGVLGRPPFHSARGLAALLSAAGP